MDFIIHYIFRDTKTNEKWKTPNHNEDDKLDDYHDIVKPEIAKALSKKLKNKFGKNCNIEIRDGVIVIVSQIFEKDTGRRSNKKIPTELRAEDFFEKIMKFIISVALKVVPSNYYKLINIRIEKTKDTTIFIIVELTDDLEESDT
jgi:hypothetical protein